MHASIVFPTTLIKAVKGTRDLLPPDTAVWNHVESVAREAAQVLGGASFVEGTKTERIYREVRVVAIGGGSEEIMLDLAGRQLGYG